MEPPALHRIEHIAATHNAIRPKGHCDLSRNVSVTIPNNPIDVPTAATAAFIASNVPIAGTIVEIGCGSGHVAAELSKRGYAVAGVESDREAVSRARELDVNVIEGSWPDVDVERANAVVFTRSLHHISRLPEAIAGVRDVLLPRGTVLVEDFAFDEASSDAINWFLTVVESRQGRALISHSAGSFVTQLHTADDPVSAWHQDHDHDLHTFAEMTHEIGKFFAIRDTQHVPYLYRYLVPVLPETPEAAVFVREVYDEESQFGKSGEFSLTGRRIVAVDDTRSV